ncbi:MoeZ/MoeB domain protein [Oesophagostomum dentatum]|uniref:MoeZ/MoeB domain protein n=1 Tax=Oesophagostomum dentatum TaxID=61180 RepID=A0A0B1TEX3_OESDE|nr:MoeZ/MoeB domain protein [Oesophagostomum dentatum]
MDHGVTRFFSDCYRIERGPCYRCLFPVPTNPAHVTNCSEGGVLGPVVGVIGSLQALEALKIAAGITPSFASKLYLFDGKYGKSRTITIRPRSRDCAVCGDHPSITQLIDYESFCGSRACDKVQNLKLLDSVSRVSPSEYSRIRHSRPVTVLVDTRPRHEFEIASLSEAISKFSFEIYFALLSLQMLVLNCFLVDIPMDELRTLDSSSIGEKLCLDCTAGDSEEVFVICHRGNDSQIAVKILEEKLKPLRVRDVIGGYEAWATEIDQEFPHY